MSLIKVKSLSQRQHSRLTEFRDKWIEIGLSTEPAQREKAEAAIRRMYTCAQLPPPRKIVWCGSPLSQGLTRAIMLDKKLRASVGDSARTFVRDSVRESVGRSVREAVGDSVWASVRESVVESVWGATGNPVWAFVWASVREAVKDSVQESVVEATREAVWRSVGGSVGEAVWVAVWASVWRSVRESVWESVVESVVESVWASVHESGYGQHDANWLGFYEYFREVCSLTKETDALIGLLEQAKYAGWYLPYQHICWVSERHHILTRDEQGRVHNLFGPAVSYPDGWSIYAVHGVRVPEYIITRPQEISTTRIYAERNVEIRRVMIDQYGPSRYLTDSGAKIIHADTYGTLYRKEIPNDEPLVMVKVVNSTPEPDGSQKDYFLRVDPELRLLHPDGTKGQPQEITARNAVASTFGMRGNDYTLHIET